MSLTIRILALFLITLLISCSAQPSSKVPCLPDLNLLPMYGEEPKCDEQIALDKEFLAESDKQNPDRREAAKFYVKKGWEYFYKNDYKTAMKRFNQAWLLDSLNADIYWGFGNALGAGTHDFNRSIYCIDKSLKLNPNNAKVWQSGAISLSQLFNQSRDSSLMRESITYLRKSLSLEPGNAQVLGMLTMSYAVFRNDSALVYMKMADAIDPKVIDREAREIVKERVGLK